MPEDPHAREDIPADDSLLGLGSQAFRNLAALPDADDADKVNALDPNANWSR